MLKIICIIKNVSYSIDLFVNPPTTINVITLPAITVKQNVCKLKPVTGLCRAAIPRFYFDSNQGICRQFVYGGCGGNQNNFKTRQECRRRCLL